MLCFLSLAPAAASAADRYAVIITGATAAPQYAIKYDSWRVSFTNLLRTSFGFPRDHVVVLAEEPADSEGPEVKPSTRENVRAALSGIARRANDDDVVLILLLGHGSTGEADGAKFNLVGPDLNVEEWAQLVQPIPGRVVFVNGASGSFPFLQKLSGARHIVITSTATPTQVYETVFPEYFIDAFHEPAADLDRDGRVSIWESFVFASAGVRKSFGDRGQLPTERPLLDDTADGLGRDALDAAGSRDGEVAKVTFLQSVPIPITRAAASTALATRRADVQSKIESLQARRPLMPVEDYQSQLEPLLLELAQIDRQLRELR
jgi:hypothetical protein